MKRRVLMFALTGCLVCGAGVGLALAADSGGSVSAGVTVVTSTEYTDATPASPEGMPSAVAASQVKAASSVPSSPIGNAGVTVLTSTTYANATPESPQGMPSKAAALQVANATQSSSTGSSTEAGSGP